MHCNEIRHCINHSWPHYNQEHLESVLNKDCREPLTQDEVVEGGEKKKSK